MARTVVHDGPGHFYGWILCPGKNRIKFIWLVLLKCKNRSNLLFPIVLCIYKFYPYICKTAFFWSGLDICIVNKDLKELYTSGKSRKLRLRPEIIDKFFAAIQKIDAARDIYDLWADPSLNFKKYEKHYSVRLSGKYRLEMEVKWMNPENTIGEFHLFEISNHYGD